LFLRDRFSLFAIVVGKQEKPEVGESNFQPEESAMNNLNSENRSSRYNTDTACPYCEGIFEHSAWCATQDPQVGYAYQIVADASKLTAGDCLILHSLGVAWVECAREFAV
jgi:hypothetical protein